MRKYVKTFEQFEADLNEGAIHVAMAMAQDSYREAEKEGRPKFVADEPKKESMINDLFDGKRKELQFALMVWERGALAGMFKEPKADDLEFLFPDDMNKQYLKLKFEEKDGWIVVANGETYMTIPSEFDAMKIVQGGLAKLIEESDAVKGKLSKKQHVYVVWEGSDMWKDVNPHTRAKRK